MNVGWATWDDDIGVNDDNPHCNCGHPASLITTTDLANDSGLVLQAAVGTTLRDGMASRQKISPWEKKSQEDQTGRSRTSKVVSAYGSYDPALDIRT